jgi:fructose-specific component phosphotransferase system IIB-like protein
MKTRLLFAAAILLFSVSLLADGLVKFKGWDTSPQGYFMTKAERQQWAAIKTDDEAQAFVDHFLSSRGPGFAAEVASRAAQADAHLTLGKKVPASKTLRGKAVILLGAPTAFDASDIADTSSVHHDNPMMANALSGGTGAGDTSKDSGSGTSDSHEGTASMGGGLVNRHYHFTFTTPSGPVDVTILADVNSGKDRAKGGDGKKLDAAFEAAAQASIKSK